MFAGDNSSQELRTGASTPLEPFARGLLLHCVRAASRLWSVGGAAAPVQVRTGVEVTGLCCVVLDQTHTA